MVDTGIFCTTTEVQRKAGQNASSTSNTEAYINQFVAEAESFINSTTRFNWSDNYASLNTDVKEILKMTASAYAAIAVINFDMSGFTSRQEAETMLDVLAYQVDNGIKLLKEIEVKTFINNN